MTMCFYDDDCDWYADQTTDEYVRSDKTAKCYDCNRKIHAGEWRREMSQLECEMCQICEDDSGYKYDMYEPPEDEEYPGPGEHPCYYGQSWQGSVCCECCKIRAAIYDLEEKEGCPEYARQPAIGELPNVINEDQGKWGDRKYTNHAIAMFPEVSEHFLLF